MFFDLEVTGWPFSRSQTVLIECQERIRFGFIDKARRYQERRALLVADFDGMGIDLDGCHPSGKKGWVGLNMDMDTHILNNFICMCQSFCLKYKLQVLVHAEMIVILD